MLFTDIEDSDNLMAGGSACLLRKAPKQYQELRFFLCIFFFDLIVTSNYF